MSIAQGLTITYDSQALAELKKAVPEELKSSVQKAQTVYNQMVFNYLKQTIGGAKLGEAFLDDLNDTSKATEVQSQILQLVNDYESKTDTKWLSTVARFFGITHTQYNQTVHNLFFSEEVLSTLTSLPSFESAWNTSLKAQTAVIETATSDAQGLKGAVATICETHENTALEQSGFVDEYSGRLLTTPTYLVDPDGNSVRKVNFDLAVRALGRTPRNRVVKDSENGTVISDFVDAHQVSLDMQKKRLELSQKMIEALKERNFDFFIDLLDKLEGQFRLEEKNETEEEKASQPTSTTEDPLRLEEKNETKEEKASQPTSTTEDPLEAIRDLKENFICLKNNDIEAAARYNVLLSLLQLLAEEKKAAGQIHLLNHLMDISIDGKNQLEKKPDPSVLENIGTRLLETLQNYGAFVDKKVVKAVKTYFLKPQQPRTIYAPLVQQLKQLTH